MEILKVPKDQNLDLHNYNHIHHPNNYSSNHHNYNLRNTANHNPAQRFFLVHISFVDKILHRHLHNLLAGDHHHNCIYKIPFIN